MPAKEVDREAVAGPREEGGTTMNAGITIPTVAVPREAEATTMTAAGMPTTVVVALVPHRDGALVPHRDGALVPRIVDLERDPDQDRQRGVKGREPRLDAPHHLHVNAVASDATEGVNKIATGTMTVTGVSIGAMADTKRRSVHDRSHPSAEEDE